MIETMSGSLGGEPTLELIAGRHPNGELIVERVLVNPQAGANSYQLLKSPMFVRGIARADVIEPMTEPKGAFKVLAHSGNLCVRVYSKQSFNNQPMVALEQELTSAIEKLGGDLDIKEPNALVYSIHVSCGFNNIEQMLNEATVAFQDVAWFYGNVYDPETGEPLDWWQEILAPE
ncbi:MAG: DUF4265 domain-containing protein [Spongiibacteraceae bacterium]